MTAHACAAAGMAPLLLEAERLGLGGSGHASGIVATEASASFRDFEAAAGRRAARAHFDQTRRAALDLAATVRRLGIKAQMAGAGAFRVAAFDAPVKVLRREADERRGAGIDGAWQTPAAIARATGLEATDGGVKLGAWAVCDPFRMVLGFAAAAAARGAEIFERSPVTKVTFDRKRATVVTARGRIVAAHVVHCTGEPTTLVRALVRHFHLSQRSLVASAAVPAKVRKAMSPVDTVVIDADTPPHRIRWTDDHRVVVSGADGPRVSARQMEKHLVQRTGQLMYELSRLYPDVSGVMPAYGWSMPLALSADGGLYAGSHRNFPHQLFAFGTAHDPARAFLASRVILRALQESPISEDQYLGFARAL
ncbi:MAG: FAD-binding oxidoreductase [Vicinamibacterales bacterium]